MSAKHSQLRHLYDVNESTDAFVIQVLINQYTDIFNELDPAPLRRRDLNSSVVDYLDSCSSEIPLACDIELSFVAPKEICDADKETRVRLGLATWLGFTASKAKTAISDSLKRAMQYVVTFILLIIGSFALRSAGLQGFVCETLSEGILIGSWVFLWEAFAIIFFKLHKLVKQYRKIARIHNAQISFRYK